MAVEAVFREDRPDVAIEVEGGRLGLSPVLECGQNRTALQDERDKKSERIPCRPVSFRLHLGPHPGFPISSTGTWRQFEISFARTPLANEVETAYRKGSAARGAGPLQPRLRRPPLSRRSKCVFLGVPRIAVS